MKTFKNVQKYFLLILILLIGLIGIGSASGLSITNAYAETAQIEQTAISQTDFNALAAQYTDRPLETIKGDPISDIESFIPIDIIDSLESGEQYSYLGKEYGFVVYAEYNGFMVEHVTYAMIIEIEFLNDKTTNTFSLEISKYSNAAYLKNPQTKKYYFHRMLDRLCLSDLIIASDIVTYGGLRSGDDGYKIHEDNSIFIDAVVCDYDLFTYSPISSGEIVANFATTLISMGSSAILNALLPGSGMLTDIIGFIVSCSGESSNVGNAGFLENSLNYNGQVSRGFLQTASSLVMSEKTYLGKGNDEKNDSVKFSYKYDNKLHNAPDFQVGFHISFNTNLYRGEMEGIKSLAPSGENDRNFGFFKVFGSDPLADMAADMLTIEDGIVVDTDTVNTFIFDTYTNKRTFAFTPTETRRYRFETEKGSEITLEGKPFTDAVLEKGKQYVFELAASQNTFIEQINIDRNSAISLGNISVGEGVNVYKTEFNQAVNIDYYRLTAPEEVRFYLYDSLGTLLKMSEGKEFSYLYNRGIYTIYVESSYSGVVETVLSRSAGDSVSSVQPLKNGQSKFFVFDPLINNYYSISGSNVVLFDGNGNEITSSDNQYLRKGNRYYVRLTGEGGNTARFLYSLPFETCDIGIEYKNAENIDNVYLHSTFLSTFYSFSNAVDIYENGELIISNVTKCLLSGGKDYYIVENAPSSKFLIQYYTESLAAVETNIKADTLYRFEIQTAAYYEFTGIEGYSVLSQSMQSIDRGFDVFNNDLGYYLTEGSYYLMPTNEGNVSLKERINSYTLNLDNSKTANVVLGKHFRLPLPDPRTNRSFNGWFIGNTQLTDASGNSIAPWSLNNLSQSNAVTSSWSVVNYYLSIIIGENEKLWLNEDGITSDYNAAGIKNQTTLLQLMDELLNFQYNNKITKVGHYITNFDISQMNDDTYVITPQWKIEEYRVLFVNNVNQTEYRWIFKYGEPFNPQIIASVINVNGYTLSHIEYNGIKTNLFESVPDLNGSDAGSNQAVNVITAVLKPCEIKVDVKRKGIKVNSFEGHVDTRIALSGNGIERVGYALKGFNIVQGQGAIEKSDGKYFFVVSFNVYKDPYIVLEIQEQAIVYNITYNCNGGEMSGEYPRIYTVENTVAFPIATRIGFRFVCWKLNGNVVQTTVGMYGDITLSAEWEGVERYVTQKGDFIISEKVVVVYETSGSQTNAINFIIKESVEEVTFISDGFSRPNKHIQIEPRNKALKLGLKNVHFIGNNYENIIDADKCTILDLYSYGENILELGKVTKSYDSVILRVQILNIYGDRLSLLTGDGDGYDDNGNGYSGGTAIANTYVSNRTMGVKVYADYLYIKTGNGAKGRDEGDTPDMANNLGKAKTNKEALRGADGATGKTGGKGGSGGTALACLGYIEISPNSEVHIICGNGGKGGKGGRGQRGQNGQEGADAAFLIYGKTGGNGGNGGRGGEGGKGGNGGFPFIFSELFKNEGAFQLTLGKGGDGGEGGEGGYGGSGGLGGWTLKKDRRYGSGSSGSRGLTGLKGDKGGDSFIP